MAREAPEAYAASSTASRSRCGSPSIRWRSLKMPGSPSSPLTTRYFGAPVAARHAAHFTAVGKYAPPRPARPAARTSSMTVSGLAPSIACTSVAYVPWRMASAMSPGSARPQRSRSIRRWRDSHSRPTSGAAAGFAARAFRRRGTSAAVTGPVTAAEVPRLLNALAANPAAAPDVGREWLSRQRRMLLERCGLADPGDIADAIRHGTYATLVHAIEGARPETVIEEVRAAGLAGRGGAYFPTAVKWAACRAATGAPKYLVVNGEEGEPGIFKDRHLMEGDPHRLLEAVLLAAYASGASRAILYVHGEAELSAERLRVAVGQAREWGLLGERILGSDLSLDVEREVGAEDALAEESPLA